MNNLVKDIMKIDFSQLKNPNFMSDQKETVIKVASSVQNPNKRSASGGSHTSQYTNQVTQGYGSTSGPELAQGNITTNSKNQYNTSGTINLADKHISN